MDEVTWFVPFEEDLKHDRIVMRHGDNERVYVPEKIGKWAMNIHGRYFCTNCGSRPDNGLSNYCKNCGADMRG